MIWQGTDIFTDVDVNNEFIPGLSLNHTMYGVNWNIYIYYNVKVALCILLNLWKEILKSDGKKIPPIKKKNRRLSHQIIEHKTMLGILVLSWGRHINV